MEDPRTSRPVLVGVKDPDIVQQLVRSAGDLARLGSGSIRLVSVSVKPRDSPFGVFTDETIIRQYADESQELLERATPPAGVSIDRDVVVARSATRGLLAAVGETDPDALVIGWHRGSGPSDAILGTTVDALIERAQCDLYVERVGREANGVDSVLLPVAGGPHVEAVAKMGTAIAARNDARVVVLSVATADSDKEQAAAFVAEARGALQNARGPDVPIETTVEEAADPTEAIVEAASAHDVVVLGATRRGSLRRKLVGSVPRQVVDRIDRTVIIARDGDTVGGPVHRLGELIRR
jgi:nucleotide-binding universal stress UspA family protein